MNTHCKPHRLTWFAIALLGLEACVGLGEGDGTREDNSESSSGGTDSGEIGGGPSTAGSGGLKTDASGGGSGPSAGGRNQGNAGDGPSLGGANSGGDTGSGGFACSDVRSTGGSIALPSCSEWLEDGLGEEDCGSTDPADYPALRRFCEADPDISFNEQHWLYWCFSRVSEDLCAEDQEEATLLCFNEAPVPSCSFDLEGSGCAEVMEACPAISVGACSTGLNTDATLQCMEDLGTDEPCEVRFFRCTTDF